mmetsp:Transcript_5445/g.15099  ORF Transcript_5445/g.15099 Transcript_5445/m.15099 type:complete len:545 (-) Transcript_5445:797-2431(-)
MAHSPPLFDSGEVWSISPRPLAIHYFQTYRVPWMGAAWGWVGHWLDSWMRRQRGDREAREEPATATGGPEEVFLNADYIALKTYCVLGRLRVRWVCSSGTSPAAPTASRSANTARRYGYPSCSALDHTPFPAAFINHEPVGGIHLLKRIKKHHDIDKDAFVRLAGDDDSKLRELQSDAVVYTSMVVEAFTAILEYLLWLYPPLYGGFMRPIYFTSMAYLNALTYCAYERARVQQKHGHLSLRQVLDKLHVVCKALVDRLDDPAKPLAATGPSAAAAAGRHFFYGDAPLTLDVVVYAYTSVLLSLPSRLVPWENILAAHKATTRDAPGAAAAATTDPWHPLSGHDRQDRSPSIAAHMHEQDREALMHPSYGERMHELRRHLERLSDYCNHFNGFLWSFTSTEPAREPPSPGDVDGPDDENETEHPVPWLPALQEAIDSLGGRQRFQKRAISQMSVHSRPDLRRTLDLRRTTREWAAGVSDWAKGSVGAAQEAWRKVLRGDWVLTKGVGNQLFVLWLVVSTVAVVTGGEYIREMQQKVGHIIHYHE